MRDVLITRATKKDDNMSPKNRKSWSDNIPNSLAGEVVDTELLGLIQSNTPENLLKLKMIFGKWASQLSDYCERMAGQASYETGIKVNPRFKWTPESSN